jgi:molecular chaperone DnaJ
MSHYQTLGVNPDASPEAIKAAYRRLAIETHPDVAGPDSTARFQAVSDAYRVLSDPEARLRYDRGASGSNEWNPFGDWPGMGFNWSSDPFGSGGIRYTAGSDVLLSIPVTLEQALNGWTLSEPFRYSRQVKCSPCDGTGWSNSAGSRTCKGCNGAGQVHRTRRSGAFSISASEVCRTCEGSGIAPAIAQPDACSHCKGVGLQDSVTELFPMGHHMSPGFHDGLQFSIAGAGHSGKGRNSVPGNAVCQIHVSDPELTPNAIRLQGANIYWEPVISVIGVPLVIPVPSVLQPRLGTQLTWNTGDQIRPILHPGLGIASLGGSQGNLSVHPVIQL